MASIECQISGHNKCYSHVPIVLSSNEPLTLYKWICRQCGFKGIDRVVSGKDEYTRLVKKFDEISKLDTGKDADSYKHLGPPHIHGA